jgi:hypothetical protein
VAVVAGRQGLRLVADARQLPAALDQGGVGALVEYERTVGALVVRRDRGAIGGRQRLGDRPHEGAVARSRRVVGELPRHVPGRLSGEPRKGAAAVSDAVLGMAPGAGRDVVARAIGGDVGAALECVLCLDSDRLHEAEGDRRRGGTHHVGTSGPGAFR